MQDKRENEEKKTDALREIEAKWHLSRHQGGRGLEGFDLPLHSAKHQ